MVAISRRRLRQIPIGRGLLLVLLLGACIGAGLAWLERRADEQKLDAVRRMPETLSPVLFPEAPFEKTPPSPLTPPPAMDGLPLYPGSLPQSFHSTVIADGNPLEMAWFSTGDSTEQLRAFYEREFKIRGLQFVAHEFSPFAGYIGYMDWLNEELHLISYIRQGSQTMVFPSRSQPTSQVEGAQLPAGVPVHPQARAAKTIRFLEPEGASRISYAATVENHSLEAVQAFYQEALSASGWRSIQGKKERGHSSLEAVNEQMAINFSFEQKQSDVRIYVLLVGKSSER